MTKTELLEVLKNGENSGVEFKRDVTDNRSFAQELVAFANLEGGRVLMGVDDDGAVVGITRPDLEEWVMTACRDKIRPEVIPYFELIRDVLRMQSGEPCREMGSKSAGLHAPKPPPRRATIV